MHPDADPKSFLGHGWAFPLAPAADGGTALAHYEDDVRQAIRIIIGTEKGERVMRPEFGAGLGAMMFEPLRTTTLALIRHRVEEALVLWEPRIDNVAVTVTALAPAGAVQIEVHYRVRLTNSFYNLVYPFFTQELRR